MDNLVQKCLAVCGGVVTKLIGIDWIVLFIWFVVVCVDVVSGVVKAKLSKQPIESSKMTDGFTRKLMPMVLVITFYLITIAVNIATGLDLGVGPNIFAVLYILAEAKSIIENFQEAGIFIPEGLSESIDKAFHTANTKKKK